MVPRPKLGCQMQVDPLDLYPSPPRFWMVEYFEEGKTWASDCHPDFFATHDEAIHEAPIFMLDISWAVRWRVVPTNL